MMPWLPLTALRSRWVAPEHNNSAKSNALTLHSPLYVHRAANGFRYVNGTPADCVHIAMTGLLGYKPDLVVSGINNGANMGDDTIYFRYGGCRHGRVFVWCACHCFLASGARLGGVASAAQKAKHDGAADAPAASDWQCAVAVECEYSQSPFGAVGRVKLCRWGRRHSAEPVITQISPRGETMYWIGSAGAAKDESEGTDFYATARGHVAMTPLKVDLTDHDHFGLLGADCRPVWMWQAPPRKPYESAQALGTRLDCSLGSPQTCQRTCREAALHRRCALRQRP